jgi:glycosyltransferase involved in cell wall biosynthesis
MLEAMALGLPCIGSRVGGIPELLPSEDMVEPRDIKGLVQKTREVTGNPERMDRMSERNLAKAREYHESVLQPKRNELYRHVRRCTQEYAQGFQ